MRFPVRFSVETIDGDRFGKLGVPYSQIADWLNLLVSPQYQAEIVSAEQGKDTVEIYFQASEGVYLYLEMRLNSCQDAALAS